MTLDNLFATLEKLSIPLELKDGKIAVPLGMLTPELRRAIIAHRAAFICRLQVELNRGVKTTKMPGMIGSMPMRLRCAFDWFQRETRKTPMADHGRQKARLTPPSQCRWLIDWLTKAKQVEFERRGFLPWQDWNAVIEEAGSRIGMQCNAMVTRRTNKKNKRVK